VLASQQQELLPNLSFCSNTTNSCLQSVRSNENAPANCKACLVVTETATPTLTLFKTLHTKHAVDPGNLSGGTFTATEEITPTVVVTETKTLTAMPDLRIRGGEEDVEEEFGEFSGPRCPPKYAADQCEYEEYEAACACIGAGVETRTVSGFPHTVTILTTEAAFEEELEEATMVSSSLLMFWCVSSLDCGELTNFVNCRSVDGRTLNARRYPL
jgi:hypothetical protein